MRIHTSLCWMLAAAVCAGEIQAAAPPSPKAPAAAYDMQNPAELAAFKKAIRAKYDVKEKAFASGDADAIVYGFYAGDEITVAARDGIFFGSKDILPEYKKDVGVNHVKIDSVRTYVNGNAGWDWADFHVYPQDGKTKPFTFAILFLWSKINGEWVCLGDYFDYGSFRAKKLDPRPGETAATK